MSKKEIVSFNAIHLIFLNTFAYNNAKTKIMWYIELNTSIKHVCMTLFYQRKSPKFQEPLHSTSNTDTARIRMISKLWVFRRHGADIYIMYILYIVYIVKNQSRSRTEIVLINICWFMSADVTIYYQTTQSQMRIFLRTIRDADLSKRAIKIAVRTHFVYYQLSTHIAPTWRKKCSAPTCATNYIIIAKPCFVAA